MYTDFIEKTVENDLKRSSSKSNGATKIFLSVFLFSLSFSFDAIFVQNIQTIIKGCPNVGAYFACLRFVNGRIRRWYLCSWSLLWLESASGEERTFLPICPSFAATRARCNYQQGLSNRISILGQHFRVVLFGAPKRGKSHRKKWSIHQRYVLLIRFYDVV